MTYPPWNEQLAHHKTHSTGPRQSMRDLQDSEELEKLFKPYAFKNKVLMVKKMAAVLNKIFWNLSGCKVKPLRTSWYLMFLNIMVFNGCGWKSFFTGNKSINHLLHVHVQHTVGSTVCSYQETLGFPPVPLCGTFSLPPKKYCDVTPI